MPTKFAVLTAESAVNILRKCVLKGAFQESDYRQWRRQPQKLLVFVSSTFTDTQHERNYLSDVLLHELRKEAKQYGKFFLSEGEVKKNHSFLFHAF
jgi:hypothetical protein